MSTKDLQSALKIIESYGLTVTRKRQLKRTAIEEKVEKEMASDRDGRWRNRKAFRLEDAQVDLIKKLWNEDVGTQEIAERVGCSMSTIYKYVR